MIGGYAREALAPGAVTAAGVVRLDEFRRAVTTALQTAKAGHVNVCMSMAYDGMDAREMSYPNMPERDLLSSIQWDLRQLLGGSGADDDAERLVDYEQLPARDDAGHGAMPGDGQQTYLVLSAPKSGIYQYLTPLHETRIYPEIVEVGAFSMPWAVPRGGGVGYLHMGPELTHFVMLDNGQYALNRQAQLPLDAVLKSAATGEAGLGALQEALMLVAESEDGEQSPAGEALLALLQWIEETLEYARVQSGAFAIDESMQTLIVSGVGATIAGIVPLIQEKTGLPIVPAVPVVPGGGPEIPTEEAPAYALAVALAQRGLAEL